ncbi:MAG: hypothetical protein AB7U63_06405 [Porticoccaceae bacterium]
MLMYNSRRKLIARTASAAAAKGVAVLLMAAGINTQLACANESNWPELSLRGFGTLGATHSSQDNADYLGNFFQPDGAGYSESVAFSVDSKLGLQLDAHFNNRLSAVIQMVSQYQHDGSYDPKTEWAYLNYELTPDFTIRVGRIVAPTFMESETRLVAYTYPWMRPPQELYDVNPITNKDGIDLMYRLNLGDATHTLQASYGEILKKFYGNSEVDVSNALHLVHSLEYRSTLFRLSYTSLDLDISSPFLNDLFDGFRDFGANTPGAAGQQALDIDNQFRSDNSQYTIFTLGARHNQGNWLFRGEWARADINRATFVSNLKAWYVTVGYQFGAIMPYITAAHLKPDSLYTPDIPLEGLTENQAQTAIALNTNLEIPINAFAFHQESLTAGVRWDALANVAVKMQFQHLRTEAGSNSSGRLVNVQPGFEPGDNANLFSLSVDFVF